MTFNLSSIIHKLSTPIPYFGVKLWIAIAICTVLALLILLTIILCCILCRIRRKYMSTLSQSSSSKKVANNVDDNRSMDRRLSSRTRWDVEMSTTTPEKQVMCYDDDHVNTVETRPVSCYTMREIEAATNGMAYESIMGSGEHGVVFHGFLMDNTHVAIKNLFGFRIGKKAFSKEAEAILLIRHKNLVKLLGYCDEGAYRMLVYEYVENGNLKELLHKSTTKVCTLTWNTRMHIIIGIAKGLAYLHEDTEPPMVHLNLKSKNILLDQQWNPKISDVGITKLVAPEWDHANAHSTGMSSYIASECDHNSVMEKSDVYSFGVLIMEIVSGKTRIETSDSEIEECLVDWIKNQVAEGRYSVIVDTNLPEMPTIKELKRVLLIALRCVDCEVEKRPRMGEIIHMLEPHDLLLCETVIEMQTSSSSHV